MNQIVNQYQDLQQQQYDQCDLIMSRNNNAVLPEPVLENSWGSIHRHNCNSIELRQNKTTSNVQNRAVILNILTNFSLLRTQNSKQDPGRDPQDRALTITRE